MRFVAVVQTFQELELCEICGQSLLETAPLLQRMAPEHKFALRQICGTIYWQKQNP